MAKGAAPPPRRHDCEEAVTCRGGRGEPHRDDRVHACGPETTVAIPRTASHRIFPTRATPLEIAAVFAAPPVEARFPDGTRLNPP